MKLGVRKSRDRLERNHLWCLLRRGGQGFSFVPARRRLRTSIRWIPTGLSKSLQRKRPARAFAMRYKADIYALRIGNVIEPHEYGALQELCGQTPAGAQAQRLEL